LDFRNKAAKRLHRLCIRRLISLPEHIFLSWPDGRRRTIDGAVYLKLVSSGSVRFRREVPNYA